MSVEKLDKERQSYRAELEQALQDDEDPIAVYDTFIKWTLSSYSGSLIARSGLVELLEEATRTFKDDKRYKTDIRFLKMWCLYATVVEHPAIVLEYVLKRGIGTGYAQVYEDYALALEQIERPSDADKAYQLGVQRRARPTERLKKRYAEFKARRDSSTQPAKPALANPSLWRDASSDTQALRQDPFSKYDPKPTLLSYPRPKPKHQPTPASSSDPNDRYAWIRNPIPPAAGKRPEKLRFNLSLLFNPQNDPEEYSIQEARAKSMGLLGKKWGPPPDAQPRQPKVGFDESATRGSGGTRNLTRKGGSGNTWMGGGAEPTVTIATKEALADVFGMYNSPEKSMRYGVAAGSKHAPVKKIDFGRDLNPVTPLAAFKVARDENADSGKTPTAFRPYVDPAAQRKENNTPGPSKFQPFVDEQPSRLPTTTPDPQRRVLGAKDPMPPPPPRSNENAIPPSRSNENAGPSRPKTPNSGVLRPLSSEDGKPPRVFTPAPPGENKPFSRKDVFTDPPVSSSTESVSNAPKVFSRPTSTGPTVFSRPEPTATTSTSMTSSSSTSSTISQPRPTVFKPFVDSGANSRQPFVPQRTRAPLASKPAPPPPPPEPEPEPELDSEEDQIPLHQPQFDQPVDDFYDTSASSELDDEPVPLMPMPVASTATSTTSEEDSIIYDEQRFGHAQAYTEEYVEDQFDEEAPMGGRLGRFQVMTPITERTYEFTSTSLRGQTTPSEHFGRPVFRREDPVQVAEQLAAELRRDDEEGEDLDGDEDDDMRNVEEQTGTLSFSDAIKVASKFKTSNPCNPFEPPIMATLLSLVPADAAFVDMQPQRAEMLETLQKFAKKKSRRASGNTSSSSIKSLSNADFVEVHLGHAKEKSYKVTDKLGEGGFGAVFEAIDVRALSEKRQNRDPDDDEEYDFGDDEDDEDEEGGGIPRVALKIVTPRNLWEFHVLRRVHSSIPAHLRNSIIHPQALYAYSDESYLVLDLCSQGTLLEIVNRAPQAGITQQGACLDELLVMFFAIELMRLLEGLHRAGFIHGDVKIDNCLLRMEDVPGPASAWDATYSPSGDKGWRYKGIKMIDFGRTIDTKLFPANQQFVGDWPTDARDCLELREGRPWTFQPDYFGLAGIIYCMLYGKYIEASSIVPASPSEGGRTRYKLSTPFKRYWQGDIWTRLFNLLLNPTTIRPDSSLPLFDEMGAIRVEMETWLQANCNRASNSLKGLLKKIGLSLLGGK